MKLQVSITICTLLLLSDFSFSENLELMGCKWNVPDRFTSNGEDLWVHQSDVPSIIFFEEGQFRKEVIQISLKPSVRRQKKLVSEVYNGYKVTVYIEYLSENKKVIFPSWTTIERAQEKGVFYLSGLDLVELVNFGQSCMPTLDLEELIDKALRGHMAQAQPKEPKGSDSIDQ